MKIKIKSEIYAITLWNDSDSGAFIELISSSLLGSSWCLHIMLFKNATALYGLRIIIKLDDGYRIFVL